MHVMHKKTTGGQKMPTCSTYIDARCGGVEFLLRDRQFCGQNWFNREGR